MMNDKEKVSVNIREVENGFVISRSWCEVVGTGDKQRHDYKSEEYYMASLPPLLAKMFSKKKTKTDFGGKETEEKDGFEEALDGMEEKDDAEEESEE